ncbi:hypothetical protein ACFQ1Q_13705 [Winogradskyella litorisediminis]|uniref:LytTr DNA-binding domain-containing protein n=1 Tax=Winogradskyella litorisediminis TaxID=1156618 RepID=A0ABW3ND35_9FLAO
MSKILTHIKQGIIVYTTLALQKINQLSIDKLKKQPKETFLKFNEIASVSTDGMPDNWISIKTINNESIFYEDKSIINFVKIAEKNSVIFQKITGKLAVNIALLKYKSNLSVVELVNGDIHKVNRRFKTRLKNSLSKIWEE